MEKLKLKDHLLMQENGSWASLTLKSYKVLFQETMCVHIAFTFNP